MTIVGSQLPEYQGNSRRDALMAKCDRNCHRLTQVRLEAQLQNLIAETLKHRLTGVIHQASECHSQTEIASAAGISQQQVSALINAR